MTFITQHLIPEILQNKPSKIVSLPTNNTDAVNNLFLIDKQNVSHAPTGFF